MVNICSLLLFLFFITNAQEGKNSQSLESQVKDLQLRVHTLEQTFKQIKGGGFTITPIITCDIKTAFDGTYSASELSKNAAIYSVVERCKEKANNKSECHPTKVNCK